MRRLVLLLALGCTERQPETPAPAAPADAPMETPSRWHRAEPGEPDPAAKALYRRAVDQIQKGDRQAHALLDVIARDHPKSRFAQRLAGESSPAVLAGVLAMAAAAAVPLLAADSTPQPPVTPDP